MCDSMTSCTGGLVGANVDLALLKLEGFSNNQVVCLNTNNARPANGAQLDNMGFGSLTDTTDPDTFQGATMITNNAACSGNAAGYFCSSGSATDPNVCPGMTCVGPKYDKWLTRLLTNWFLKCRGQRRPNDAIGLQQCSIGSKFFY